MKKLLLIALFLFPTIARAQVFVKPSGQQAIPARVQNLKADVEIVGAFAITKWEMNIQMERGAFGGYFDRGGVCDFIIARPRDAKVTAFSVAQSNGNLVGRVVEKSLATPRAAFRAAPTDPLLRSGLNAANSFRASIYPLSTWNGVIVRGTWVQVLNATKIASQNRSIFRLPLLSLRGATTRLGALDVRVSVRDASGQRVSNSFGLPTKSGDGARNFTLTQKNFRVTRDLVVNITRPAAAGQAALLVSPNAAKTGGYFAIAATSNRAVTSPGVTGEGVEAASVLSPKTARAGEVMRLSGTYRGDLSAFQPRLSGDFASNGSMVPIENPVATALWATQKIAAIGSNGTTRAQVISLSKTYNVASVFTSWLAVDDRDLEIYSHALVSAQLDPLVREYWIRVSDGQEKSARSVRLRNAIAQISRFNKLNVADEINTRLGSAYGFVLWQKYRDYNPHTGKANRVQVEKRIARMGQRMLTYVAQLTGKKAQRGIDWATPIYGGELLTLRTEMVKELRKPHPDYVQLRQWELRFARLYGSTNLDPRLNFWRAEVKSRQLETETQSAQTKGNQAQLARLQQERIENSRQVYFVNNIGDPPIYVSAPADARQVVAIMPGGQVKVLDYNAGQKRWEGNYDVPTDTREGTYRIQIVIMGADNSRRSYAMRFRVDTSPPVGSGRILAAPPSREQDTVLRLEIEHGGDVARVTALLPWGERVSLLPSTTHGNRFFALVKAPREFWNRAVSVKYILVDRAHNLTTIEAESVATPESVAAPKSVAAPAP